MKRTPLARRTALVARVPLQRGGQLARSGLASTKRLARKPVKRVQSYTGPSREVRELVIARCHGRCEICGQGVQVWHHRQPRGRGGSSDPAINSPANLLGICNPCHDVVESFRLDAYAKGYLVRRPINPAKAPVHLHGYGLAYLDDRGGKRVVA